MVSCGIVMVSLRVCSRTLCADNVRLRPLKVSSRTTDSFSVRFIGRRSSRPDPIPSRDDMALGGRPGGGVPRSGLLPLVVRCNNYPEPPPLSRLLVGTSVQSSASVRQFSSQQPRYRVPSAVCALYAEPAHFGGYPLTLLLERLPSRRWTESAENLAGRGYLFWRAS